MKCKHRRRVKKVIRNAEVAELGDDNRASGAIASGDRRRRVEDEAKVWIELRWEWRKREGRHLYCLTSPCQGHQLNEQSDEKIARLREHLKTLCLRKTDRVEMERTRGGKKRERIHQSNEESIKKSKIKWQFAHRSLLEVGEGHGRVVVRAALHETRAGELGDNELRKTRGRGSIRQT